MFRYTIRLWGAVLSLTLLTIGSTTVASAAATRFIESDDNTVEQSGAWQSVALSSASGGSYLVNSAAADTLALSFDGTYLEVIYVAGPDFGDLAVEVDEQVLQTIDTHSGQLTTDNHAVFDDLTEAAHQVKVYAVDGQVAVDAFSVSDATSQPTPDTTSQPTPEPTLQPTSEPTLQPTSEPTRDFDIVAQSTPIGPIGGGAVYTRDPQFTWQEDPGTDATWYKLWVANSAGTTVYLQQWYDKTLVCAGGTCSVRAGLNLPGSDVTFIQWQVQPWSPTSGAGTWSTPVTFSIALPVRNGPSGIVVANDGLPTYSWNTTGLGETYYQLYISGPSGYVFNGWYDAASVCIAGACNIKPTSYRNVLYEGSAYEWYIRVWGPQGYGPWRADAYNFNINAADPVLPGSLTASQYGDLRLQWSDNANTASYEVIVLDGTGAELLNKWYQKGNSAVSCNGTICTLVPALYLTNGSNYRWYVRAKGPGGQSAQANDAFYVAMAPPVMATSGFSVFEAESFTDTYGYSWLVFQWPAQADASWYRLRVTNAAETTTLHESWYRGTSSCSGVICQASLPDLHFSNGAYHWGVEAWGAGGTSVGVPSSWSWPHTFSFGMTPAVLTSSTPSGTITNPRPTFTINKTSGAAMRYRIQVTNTATSAVVLDQSYQLLNCSSPCSRTFTPNYEFANGNYSWRAQGWGPGGDSSWSSTQTFTVAAAAPGVPTLMSPTNGSIVATYDRNVTFYWNRGSNASWHHLEVKNSSGTVLVDQWVQCWSSTCTATATLPIGNFLIWRVQSWNGAGGGGGTYSAWTAFFTLSVLDMYANNP
jgi:hypothetical protein